MLGNDGDGILNAGAGAGAGAGQDGGQGSARFRLTVPSFNGTRDNVAVVAFITRAELWVRASGSNDEEAASALIYAFSDNAEHFGQALINSEDPASRSWVALKETIRQHYLCEMTSSERKQLIMKVKQKPNQHPLDYWLALEVTLHLLDSSEFSAADRALDLYR